MLSYLSSLPISVLRCLDTEANKFYDRIYRLYDAALLTRCYTQHALRPVIHSKINHIRACLVVNPIKVNSFAYHLNCMTVGRASD